MNTEPLVTSEEPSLSQIRLVQMDEKKTPEAQKSNNSELDGVPPEVKDKSGDANESASVAKLKNAKSRKKYDCSVQHVLRALNSLTTPEEKLAAMCKKYADLFDENRKLQSSLKQYEKQLSLVLKERDQVRTDLAKLVLSRSRLESLCRELQRQNKEIKEESFQKIREEEEKRKEVSAKFQVTLNEITELMKQDNDKTMKLRDDNIDMTTKLKSIYEQSEMREQQIEKMAKQMALESQLYEARIAKMEMETSAEKEMLLREKQQLLVTLTEYQAKFQEYQTIEMTLRNQVALYNNKYEEFEKSLTRSNKMFGGFKEEMESMSNKIVKLESETAAWKMRWEKTQKALIEMASEKQKSDQEIVVAAKQMSTLHKLCRTLQTERAQLLAKLKHKNALSCCSDNLSENLLENTSVDDVTTASDSCGNEVEQGIEKRVEVPEKLTANPKTENGELKVNKKMGSRRIAKAKLMNETGATKNDEIEKSLTAVENSAVATSDDALITGLSDMQLSSDKPADLECSKVADFSQNADTDCTNSHSNDSACLIDSQPQGDFTSNSENSLDATEDTLKDCSPKCTIDEHSVTKQFAFPQTDTFSFTYNGTILNELKNNFENDIDTQPFAGQAFAAASSSCDSTTPTSNSEKFVFKKSTHSSKTKISPKKKNKK